MHPRLMVWQNRTKAWRAGEGSERRQGLDKGTS